MDLASLSEELVEALGRLPGERDKPWKALLDYACMQRRSLAQLFEQYKRGTEVAPTRRLRTLKEWSTIYDWQSRVVQFDLVAAEEKVKKWAERQEELNEMDWNDGNEARGILMIDLRGEKDVGKKRIIIAALVDADKLMRLATASPTDNVNMYSGAMIDGSLEHELKRLGYVREAAAALLPEGDPDADEDSAEG